MPLHVQRPGPRTPRERELLANLVEELRAPKSGGQPIILEQHGGKNGAVFLSVIWDRWEPSDLGRRGELITEAFTQARGEEIAKHIGYAAGYTVSEAARIGLLPFKLALIGPKEKDALPEKYRKAMIAEGASVLENPAAPVLRFRTLEEADAYARQLEARLPGSRWRVVEERFVE